MTPDQKLHQEKGTRMIDLFVEQVVSEVLREDSYSEENIPQYFLLIFPTKVGLENGLMNGYLDNFKGQGISDNAQILDLTSEFDSTISLSILIMPGKETVELNSLSRFMYDNPNYWYSGDLYALARVYHSNTQNMYEQFKLTLSRIRGYENHQGNEYLVKMASKIKPSHLPEKFKGLNHFAQTIVDVAKKIKEEFDYDYTIPSLESVKLLIIKEHERMKNTFAGEGEWVSKSNKLVIPRTSIIFIKNTTEDRVPLEVILKLRATYWDVQTTSQEKITQVVKRLSAKNKGK